jgi:deoxyribose-phosphate aldolase
MSLDLTNLLSLADDFASTLPAVLPAFDVPAGQSLAGFIDHTLLKPDATGDQVKKLCDEARQYQFATVCINPAYVSLAAESLRDAGVGICSVVGFPLGATMPEIKAFETHQVIQAGATEIDMVINIGALKSGNYPLVLSDVQAVVDAAFGRAHVKVILEMCFLDVREKIIGCLICKQAGADFVKTSTGFASGGATSEDVSLMRRVVGAKMGVKAAGGIRTLRDAHRMIESGANRLGASAGISILKEAQVL